MALMPASPVHYVVLAPMGASDTLVDRLFQNLPEFILELQREHRLGGLFPPPAE